MMWPFSATRLGWLPIACCALLVGCLRPEGGGSDAAEIGDAGDASDASEARDATTDAADEVEARRDRGADADAWPDGPVLFPTCGDRHVDAAEECDDGNRLNGDECDWQCHLGPGDFDYPDPDPSVPPIEAAGPAVEAVPPGESVSSVGVDARSLALAWGGRSYALAYVVDSPQYGFRVRMLDERGGAISEAWAREEAWGPPRLLLGRGEDAFGVSWSTGERSPVKRVILDDDGTERSTPTDLVSPTREFPYLVLQDLAWGDDRYALLIALCAEDWGEGGHGFSGCVPRIQAATGAGDALPYSVLLDPYEESGEVPARIAGRAGGFALADGSRVILLSPELVITGWSGFLTCGGDCRDKALAGVVSTGDGLLVLWTEEAAGEDHGLDLWAVRVDGAGELAGPPRMVVESLAPSVSGEGDLRVAYGPAGAGIAYSVTATVPDAEVRIVNTDRWGNPRSEGVVVFSGGADGYDARNPFAIAADGTGYAVVAVVGHWWAGDERILFRRYVPAP